MQNPVVIYTSNQRYEVEVLRAKLEEHQIASYILDKQDSAYISIGEAELYVEEEDLATAKKILAIE